MINKITATDFIRVMSLGRNQPYLMIRQDEDDTENEVVESVEKQKTRQRAHVAELDAFFAFLQSRAFNGEL